MNERHNDLHLLRVLLVEDEPAIAKLLKLMLRDLGVLHVHWAPDGLEAMKYLDAHEGMVNTVISDWNMPQMNGMELLRQVRTAAPNVQFIMITGRATAEGVMEARSLGVNAFIAKPFDPGLIHEKLSLIAFHLAQLKADSVRLG